MKMEYKTKITAEPGKQEILISRDFEISVKKLFKAYTTPQLVEQWMGNKVLQLDNFAFGAYKFEVHDAKGQLQMTSQGVIHEFKPEQSIIRTFEMLGTPFPVQLEYLSFEAIDEHKSRLLMKVIYKSEADREAILKLPFAYGINMAHSKLEELFKTKSH